MMSEKKILQVIAEQQEYIKGFKTEKWVSRKEENLFEFDSSLAQVVIGVRRSGKSTICQEVNYEEMAKFLGVTDNTIKKYVDYLRQAFLLQLLTKHSYKNKARIRNAKSYIIDPGLQNNRDNSFASENIGWRLENVVFIELLRRCSNSYLDIYYHKTSSRSKEVDFVVCNQNKAVELIQVAYDIDNDKTFARETSSLINASATLQCDNLSLIAFTDTHDVKLEGKTIHIVSAIEWLLRET